MSPTPVLDTTGKKIRTCCQVGFLSLIGLALILFSLAFWKSSSNYRLGEKYLRSGEHFKAILAFEQCLLYRLPGHPYRDSAVKRISEIGDSALQKKDLPIALQAYHALLFSTASLAVFGKDYSQISREAGRKVKQIDPHWIGNEQIRLFPNPLWSLASGLFLVGWIGAVIGLIRFGFDKTGKKDQKFFGFFLFVGVILFSLWLTAIILL